MSTTRGESEKRAIPNIAGQAMTVRGPIDPSQLGVAIMHEHLFLELAHTILPTFDTPATELAMWNQKLTLDNLHLARDRKPFHDNVFYYDEKEAIFEVTDYRNAGGSTFVDVTSKGLRPDPLAMRRVSYATGVNVIMGTGWYVRHYYPADMDQRTVDELADEIIRDVTVGVGQTGIRAGIIGEVGIDGNPITPNEAKSIRASARASRATGAAITFHQGGRGREKLECLSMVGEEGADLNRVIMGHTDIISADLPLMKELAEQGVYLEFDLLGKLGVPLVYQPRTLDLFPRPWAVDAVCAEAVVNLIEAGHEDRILLSHDVFPKLQYKSYGGTGYAFVLEKFLPHLRTMGVTEEQTNKLVVDNPRRVLTFVAPQ